MRQADLLVVSRAGYNQVKDVRDCDRETQQLAAFRDDQFYVFSEPMRSSEFDRVVAITIEPGRIPLLAAMTITEPATSGEAQTLPAAAWLRNTYKNEDHACMKFPEQQYEEQQLWWARTGKSFRLFDLPPELRIQVYLQIIGAVVLPDLHYNRITLGRGFEMGKEYDECERRDPDIDPPNLTILCVNKQINEEALKVAHMDTFKRLRVFASSVAKVQPTMLVPDLIRSLRTSGSRRDFLRNIQLEMSAACYLASADIIPMLGDPLRIQRGEFRLVMLRGFRALRKLDLRFISPKHPDALCPWALVVGQSDNGAHSCQKKWIEWFLAMAYERLKSLESTSKPIRFTLSGCVKTSTRTKWEHVLNEKVADHRAAVRSMVAKIAETAQDGPIPCECSLPCPRANAGGIKQYSWDEHDVRYIDGLQEHIDEGYWSFRD
ncbi:hypothetical protein FB567DRAFT_515216 [Paraphoma chrysanthemicola]|uniref:Uncharacterized protein n=1 Tax=Paraphoma chrysanthemicola TaxID=798071 RepID=A0A8K0RHG1_9PLEO|nr:hypothetical protein FB567DRAFT_515216 [Paraphoma chrysanthemicola]